MKYILAISAFLALTTAASAQFIEIETPGPYVRRRPPVVVVPMPRPRPESPYEYRARCILHPFMPDCPRGRAYPYEGPDGWDHD
jgi:hypothetical protein